MLCIFNGIEFKRAAIRHYEIYKILLIIINHNSNPCFRLKIETYRLVEGVVIFGFLLYPFFGLPYLFLDFLQRPIHPLSLHTKFHLAWLEFIKLN
ncbi:hypothetical protein BpHYR1_011595 [Brachionus plicatilis]|uniref:Uncharacterized protein n=1 Tax=Brachionus plicatilis TaxID=10195 RepID=A0A3M7S2M6_BRAPC|nr:hypothetical protein BpHYR1_011595 [Brachionus plicatilis]